MTETQNVSSAARHMTEAFRAMGKGFSKIAAAIIPTIDSLSLLADAHRRHEILILSEAIADDWRPLHERLRYRWRRRQVRVALTRSVEARLARKGWAL